VAIARTANAIGGGDWADGELVPKIVRAITSATPILVRHPSTAMMWQHVLEPVRAHLLLAQQLYEQGQEFSGAWNFAPRDENAITSQRLAENFVEHWGTGELAFEAAENAPQTASVFRLNTHKAQTLLEWRPALSLKEAIAWTVEWYKAFYSEPASSWRVTEDQIRECMRPGR
jgi:CDP-glucose 4,6-dehydratase